MPVDWPTVRPFLFLWGALRQRSHLSLEPFRAGMSSGTWQQSLFQDRQVATGFDWGNSAGGIACVVGSNSNHFSCAQITRASFAVRSDGARVPAAAASKGAPQLHLLQSLPSLRPQSLRQGHSHP